MLQYSFCIRKNAFYLYYFVGNSFFDLCTPVSSSEPSEVMQKRCFPEKSFAKKTHGPIRSHAFFFEKIG